MGQRCQVCDGPVVNGRCKYCGMPYRNDAVMYHLNEDRSEHYRHASEKVRKAMKENEIPLPDRTAKSTAKGKNTSRSMVPNTAKKSGNPDGEVNPPSKKPTDKTVNKTTDKTSDKLPQTGQLWWPVLVLLFVGAICLLAGRVLRDRKEEKNR